MRRKGRIDANQPEIVKALRLAGATVLSLAPVGNGCPDLLIGKGNINILAEIKDSNQPVSKRKLTDDERAFHASWLGQVAVVETAEQALKLISELT